MAEDKVLEERHATNTCQRLRRAAGRRPATPAPGPVFPHGSGPSGPPRAHRHPRGQLDNFTPARHLCHGAPLQPPRPARRASPASPAGPAAGPGPGVRTNFPPLRPFPRPDPAVRKMRPGVTVRPGPPRASCQPRPGARGARSQGGPARRHLGRVGRSGRGPGDARPRPRPPNPRPGAGDTGATPAPARTPTPLPDPRDPGPSPDPPTPTPELRHPRPPAPTALRDRLALGASSRLRQSRCRSLTHRGLRAWGDSRPAADDGRAGGRALIH